MTKDKVRGMMLGVAIGDQLGMPAETYTSNEIQRRFGKIMEYRDPDPDHKWFGGLKSRWTDDTQLTLVVAESLIAKKCIDMDDLAARHIAALKEGDLGWGKNTRESVKKLAVGIDWSKSGSYPGLGNGVAMKVAPLAICTYFSTSHSKNINNISSVALMTHANDMAAESALAQVCAVGHCLNSTALGFLRDLFVLIVTIGSKRKNESVGNITTLRMRLEAFRALKIEKLRAEEKSKLFGGANSEVHNSLPFCYSMFLENPTSIETLYDTVNAGGDTDTNGSIVGALLGALNGTKIFPEHLVNRLWQKDRILDTADRLCDAFGIKN